MSIQNLTVNNTGLHTDKIRALAVFIILLSVNFSVFAATLPESQELIQQLGIQKQDVDNLDRGEIVFFDVAEGDEKELAAGAAIYLPTAANKLMAYIKSKGMLSLDTELTAEGTIPPQASLDAFKGFAFKSGSDEASDFLAAKPGSEFNLSTQEFQELKAVNPAQPDAASAAYRKILFQRWQAYRNKGLKGIDSYDRGNGKAANPSGELLTATMENKMLTRYFPELQKAWFNYPATLPTGSEEQFLWRNRKVESRPTAILTHRVMVSTNSGGIILARQFYVGHSYNSNQITIASLPYREGSLVFFTNRTFTDQVAGFSSSIKRSFGNKQARSEMAKLLTKLRKGIK